MPILPGMHISEDARRMFYSSCSLGKPSNLSQSADLEELYTRQAPPAGIAAAAFASSVKGQNIPELMGRYVRERQSTALFFIAVRIPCIRGLGSSTIKR
jgi:hypothetical protein